MTDVAGQQIVSFVDRIMRLMEDGDAIKGDIKEVYAEAKGQGFDKTVLGLVVRDLRARDKNAEKVEETDALYDLYRGAYERAKTGMEHAPRVRTHVQARETISHPAVDRPDDAGNAAVVPSQAVACEAGAPDPSASHSIQELAPSDQEGHSTGSTPKAHPVGSPSVAGSAATASPELVAATKLMGVSSLINLAGPSGPAPLGDFDPDDDMPAFLRRSKPLTTALTA